MLSVPLHIVRRFEAILERKAVSVNTRSYYNTWLRFYLDLCHKYAFEPSNGNGPHYFIDKLQQKRQSDVLRKQAFHAVTLYYELITDTQRVGAIAQGNAK